MFPLTFKKNNYSCSDLYTCSVKTEDIKCNLLLMSVLWNNFTACYLVNFHWEPVHQVELGYMLLVEGNGEEDWLQK